MHLECIANRLSFIIVKCIGLIAIYYSWKNLNFHIQRQFSIPKILRFPHMYNVYIWIIFRIKFKFWQHWSCLSAWLMFMVFKDWCCDIDMHNFEATTWELYLTLRTDYILLPEDWPWELKIATRGLTLRTEYSWLRTDPEDWRLLPEDW